MGDKTEEILQRVLRESTRLKDLEEITPAPNERLRTAVQNVVERALSAFSAQIMAPTLREKFLQKRLERLERDLNRAEIQRKALITAAGVWFERAEKAEAAAKEATERVAKAEAVAKEATERAEKVEARLNELEKHTRTHRWPMIGDRVCLKSDSRVFRIESEQWCKERGKQFAGKWSDGSHYITTSYTRFEIFWSIWEPV